MASLQAAGTSYATHGEAMIPFYIFYSMFGFQRTGDQLWAAGDARARGFLMAVFGGPGTDFGPVIGAFILSVIYEYLSSSISTAAALLFGIVIVLAVVFMPRGLMDLGRGIRRDGLGYFLRNVRAHGL